MSVDNNETIHISLGNTANHLSSHLLNLQGLAATSSSSSSSHNDGPQSSKNHGDGNNNTRSLCDPTVTHDISSLNSDYYAGSSGSRYVYVPRALIVDGRDAFGYSWGDVANNNSNNSGGGGCNYGTISSGDRNHVNSSQQALPTWNGSVAVWDATNLSEFSIFDGNSQQQLQHQQCQQTQGQIISREEDPLLNFRNAASVIGLNPAHSRFMTSAPTHSYNSGTCYDSDRHVNWNDEGEEEEENDDDYCYGQDRELLQEQRRRQLERMNEQTLEVRKNWMDCMADAWEDAFYHDRRVPVSRSSLGESIKSGGREGDAHRDGGVPLATNANSPDRVQEGVVDHATNQNNICSTGNNIMEREIHWNDYWMPPRPSPSKYQVPLPFDTMSPNNNSALDPNQKNISSSWSSSFFMGYQPSSGGGGGGSMGGGGGSSSAEINHYWRENTLSEALRKVLEGCDVVKGFNVFVDGGHSESCGGSTIDDAASSSITGRSSSSSRIGNKHAKQLSQIIAGGGFHAGLATSFLEELQEECRSAGRWAVMVDPFSLNSGGDDAATSSEGNQVNEFRRRVNAGLALHGLSTNADAFLPVSIEGAYRALHGGDFGNKNVSRNRILFEGSAAAALALEASSLFYRLHRQKPSSNNSNPSGARSRLGIQSGFFQGYSGNAGYEDDGGCNDPFATAPSLTYHEFLACARPSSDKRRSILELDALLRPLSFPTVGQESNFGGGIGAGGVNALLAAQSSAATNPLMSLALAGIIGNPGGGGNGYLSELHQRMMAGTSLEKMKMEQDQQYLRYSRSRGSHSSRQREPGEWLEDISTNAGGAGGVLSSLSGNLDPFGRRANHHHFALSTSLRPATSDRRSSAGVQASGVPGACGSTAYLRPIMESLGVKYRPEVSLGLVVKDTVVDLTGVGSYWRSIFSGRECPASQSASYGSGIEQQTQRDQQRKTLSPRDLALHTPILSVLGNSTRSYPRLSSVSSGFVDALHARRNTGYFSRDVMAGLLPEKDDCEEALEYCRELVDVYEPPLGSGLVDGEDDNDNADAYFDED